MQRGRDLEGVLKQYLVHVKPAYQSYIAPSMAHADIIVPRGGDNLVAIALIVQHVHKQLQLRGFKVREKLAVAHVGQPLPGSLYVLKDTPQVRLGAWVLGHAIGGSGWLGGWARLLAVL